MTGTTLDVMATHQFNDQRAQELLPRDVWKRFRDLRESGEDLSGEDMDAIAECLFEWSTGLGAVNFAHIFYPARSSGAQIGGAAGMKHDSFVELDHGAPSAIKPIVLSFEGKRMFTGETDGSSFPNGGLRATHTAAGFTSWDRSSAPWVYGDTLYIPCVLVSHYGHALDEKTPLLRSSDAICRESRRLMQHTEFEAESTKVTINMGCEQEFFVIDREMYMKRPDLFACGRTLIGAAPPRGQNTDLNYFGTIPPRVKALFEEFQERAWKLGISSMVSHNEVAPAQHEFAPIYLVANAAADQNILSMDVLNQVAIDHGLMVLFHEKPFKGLNGSGKHNNWGLTTSTGKNVFSPGTTDAHQRNFMAMVSCLAYACYKHGDVIRVGVATATNDHRLGAQEAPPAIISLYTGIGMEEHIRKIIDGAPLEGYKEEKGKLDTGARACVNLVRNLEDRNRTAPFPFCGNRFEFRAVGSAQNINFPLTMLNTAVAEGMHILSSKVESGTPLRDAVAEMFRENWDTIFNGNGYGEEWNGEGGEAERRGLLNLRTSVDAYEYLNSAKNQTLFDSMKVLSPKELKARQEVLYENYSQHVLIEANCMVDMMETGVLPACARDLQGYAGTALSGRREEIYAKVAAKAEELKLCVDALPHNGGHEESRYCCDVILPAMETLRAACDQAEGKCAAALWPYPNYSALTLGHHSEPPLRG